MSYYDSDSSSDWDQNRRNHLYCRDCDRQFQSENALSQHLHSRKHVGRPIRCSYRDAPFTTATGLTHHLERGTAGAAINHLESGSCGHMSFPKIQRMVINLADYYDY